jgi:hypothetical protein
MHLTRIKRTDTINLVEGSRLSLDSVSRKIKTSPKESTRVSKENQKSLQQDPFDSSSEVPIKFLN